VASLPEGLSVSADELCALGELDALSTAPLGLLRPLTLRTGDWLLERLLLLELLAVQEESALADSMEAEGAEDEEAERKGEPLGLLLKEPAGEREPLALL